MLGDKQWLIDEVRRLTEVSARMLAAHHRAEGQLIVYRDILAAFGAEEQDANSNRVPSPDDTEQGIRVGD